MVILFCRSFNLSSTDYLNSTPIKICHKCLVSLSEVSEYFKVFHIIYSIYHVQYKCGSRGGGAGDPDPPAKLQVIRVSIGNKQLDPPGRVGPPPHPGKCWTASGTLKNDSFPSNLPLTSVTKAED